LYRKSMCLASFFLHLKIWGMREAIPDPALDKKTGSII
jgi:hypothetical protein